MSDTPLLFFTGVPACDVLADSGVIDFVDGEYTARALVLNEKPGHPAQGRVVHDGAAADMPGLIAEAVTYCVLQGATLIRTFEMVGTTLEASKKRGERK